MLLKIENGGNEKLPLKVVVYVLFSLGFHNCQMTSQLMTSFQELLTNKLMRKILWINVIFIYINLYYLRPCDFLPS